jgi:hypothetical protein
MIGTNSTKPSQVAVLSNFMSEINFPKRHEDGAFNVCARFTMSDPSILPLVQDYLKAWLGANCTWIRIWRSNVIEEERLDFYSDFISGPRIENGCDGVSFSVVLEGRPAAKRWKDWAVHLVHDITAVFQEVKFERFDS